MKMTHHFPIFTFYCFMLRMENVVSSPSGGIVKELWHLRQTANGMHHDVTLGTERQYHFDESAMIEVIHIAKIISNLRALPRVRI